MGGEDVPLALNSPPPQKDRFMIVLRCRQRWSGNLLHLKDRPNPRRRESATISTYPPLLADIGRPRRGAGGQLTPPAGVPERRVSGESERPRPLSLGGKLPGPRRWSFLPSPRRNASPARSRPLPKESRSALSGERRGLALREARRAGQERRGEACSRGAGSAGLPWQAERAAP